MSSRNEIIELVVVRAAPEEQQGLRQLLATYTTEQLEQVERLIIQQEISKNAEEELIRIQAEREATRLWHQHETQQAREPQRKAGEKAQLEQDRETFRLAARKYGLSDIESNFNVVRSILGPAFDGYQIGQILVSNAASLVPASQAELEQWASEAQEEREDFLVNRASPLELRAAAQTEKAQRRAQYQRQEQERQIKIREQAEVGQHPMLPEFTSDGVKVDAAFFKKLADTNIKLYRQYCSKYGFSQITTRLNGGV